MAALVDDRIASLASATRVLKVLAAASLFLAAGCQVQAVSVAKLEIHQAFVNRSGLTPIHQNNLLRVTCETPALWDQLPLKSNLLYAHQQWRSPDRHVGIGIAYLHTPVPFSPQTLIWLAKTHYAKSDDASGKLLGTWTDTLGRCWFDAENDSFHIRGYAMTRGTDAWIVYSGYRIKANPPVTEILLAARAAESVAPLPASELPTPGN